MTSNGDFERTAALWQAGGAGCCEAECNDAETASRIVLGIAEHRRALQSTDKHRGTLQSTDERPGRTEQGPECTEQSSERTEQGSERTEQGPGRREQGCEPTEQGSEHAEQGSERTRPSVSGAALSSVFSCFYVFVSALEQLWSSPFERFQVFLRGRKPRGPKASGRPYGKFE